MTHKTPDWHKHIVGSSAFSFVKQSSKSQRLFHLGGDKNVHEKRPPKIGQMPSNKFSRALSPENIFSTVKPSTVKEFLET
ncbi:MAG: hypothetical protein KA713_10175 [Chryseotalea sp. WA131a]|nr:MAG: hypothetical protein KA713_10175 [Chryseotalea sp. WA131a]